MPGRGVFTAWMYVLYRKLAALQLHTDQVAEHSSEFRESPSRPLSQAAKGDSYVTMTVVLALGLFLFSLAVFFFLK